MEVAREAAPCEDVVIQAVRCNYIGLNAQYLGRYSGSNVLFGKAIASLQGGLIRERLVS